MQNNVKIEDIVAALPEIYQPIFNHPELSEAVSRDCEDRWTYIEKIYRQLEDKLKRPLKVLDLGCAQGYFSLSLATCGATVLGIDYLDKNIAVCQSLAKENAKLKVNFEIGKIEEVIEKLAINQYDLVLGLSVFHHIVYEHGLDWTKKLLENLASKVTLGIFEIALKNEPLYWANAQAEKTRDLLDGFCFVRQITSFSTHLSLICRPMYVASNVYWMFDDIVEQFNKTNKNPHLYANGTHENTRQYFMSEDKITKLFLFDNQNRYKLNHIEYENEVDFLKKYSALWDSLPKILHYEQSENEAWIVRTTIRGKLLCDIIDKNELYNADQIIKDILNQVVALESCGLYHNDIRTWNVLIREDTSACLIDYGAISKKEQDCQWPYDKYLSFLTFVREVLGHKTIIPGFFRADKFDMSTLPEPYKSVFFNFFNLGLDVISFEKLKELLENFDLVSDYSAGMTIYGEAIDNAIEISRNNLLLFKHQAHEANERVAQAEQNVHEANVRAEAFFQRAEQAEMMAAEANERVAQAEQNIHEANVRAEAFFQRAEQAEMMAAEANERVAQAEQNVHEANVRAEAFSKELNKQR
ncbi:methyltransferase domain-containing protein [Sulfurospirillum diekertiae]|uniref:non-specific serine/threonine protein kinase n=1 Tax=Sulfurospirillum diekertiae TaxID=1854492 RepID=A0AA92FGQ5_9BACT|nr:methyltransferase domain-containing protein [Sulfurospirillum diekertiae]QIR75455.2 methyltransferase domain-containing protein [Sulfurospirillum diekertiae]